MAGGSRQVFVSYARNDAERVDALVAGLRQLGYDAWLDKELTGGQAWLICPELSGQRICG
jgi:hypothetical protein